MKLIYTLILLFASASVSQAKPIRFIFEVKALGGIWSGSGFRQFDSFTFRAFGDTDNLVYSTQYRNYTIPTTAELDFGEAGVYPLPFWKWGQTYSEVSMYAGSLTFNYRYDEWNSTGLYFRYPDISHWDMKSSYGPLNITVDQDYFFRGFPLGGSTLTTGPLNANVEGGLHPGTFTAIVTPEPSAILLVAGSLVGLVGRADRPAISCGL